MEDWRECDGSDVDCLDDRVLCNGMCERCSDTPECTTTNISGVFEAVVIIPQTTEGQS